MTSQNGTDVTAQTASKTGDAMKQIAIAALAIVPMAAASISYCLALEAALPARRAHCRQAAAQAPSARWADQMCAQSVAHHVSVGVL